MTKVPPMPDAVAGEHIAFGNKTPAPDMLPHIELREYVSGRYGANGLSTGTAAFAAGAVLPYHIHGFSEAVTILTGIADVEVEGRKYRLRPFDCIHFPAGTAHRFSNPSSTERLKAHWAFATDQPSRELVADRFREIDRRNELAKEGEPEHVTRFGAIEPYKLADGARFYDLFAGRFGAEGICGGYGEFDVTAGLPCHTHHYDESITIVSGKAACYVAGRHYRLSDCDTALVPRGLPHRFVNAADSVMAMIWVYAGSEPERVLVETGYCDGSLTWSE